MSSLQETSSAADSTTTSSIHGGCSSKNVFDHVFEGWSVWLEPCPLMSRYLFEEVEKMSKACGGRSSGCHPFVPHCTLLYNIDESSILVNGKRQNEAEIGTELLQRSLETFRQEEQKAATADGSDADVERSDEINEGNGEANNKTDNNGESNNDMDNNHSCFWLYPSQFYYFEYPKTADDGRGFGCVIYMLLLQATSKLKLLQKCIKETFPPDERHVESGEFIPHMALVYAPESKAEFVKEYTNKKIKQGNDDSSLLLLQPFCARYLSLWSTKGRIHEWYRIARIEI